MNTIMFIGHTTNKPELKTANTGKNYVLFSVAVPKGYKTQDGEPTQPDFIPCIAWNKQAEFCSQCLEKGSKVAIVGRLQSSTFDMPDGTRRNVLKVLVQILDAIIPPKKNENGFKSNPYKEELLPFNETDDDQLPF